MTARSFCFAATVCACSLPLLVLGQTPAKSELPELVTDRPDFTESAEVVGRGMLQLESGFTLDRSREEGDRSRAMTAPYPLIRVGLTRRVEFRFAEDGFSWTRITSTDSERRVRGVSDFSLGGKVKLWDQTSVLPDFAIIGAVTMPKGHPYYIAAGYDPEVKLCLAKDAPLGIALSSNFNFASVKDEQGRAFGKAVSLSAGHALVREFSGYAEWYMVDADRAKRADHVFNAGVTHPVGPSAQIDVLVGRLVHGPRMGWFVGAGFSVRTSLLPGLRR